MMDLWALKVVYKGLHLQFQDSPPRNFIVLMQLPVSPAKRASLNIAELLMLQAIGPVAEEEQGQDVLLGNLKA